MYEYFAIIGLPPDADVGTNLARGEGDEDETLNVPASVIASWPPAAPQEILNTLPGFVAPQGVRVHFVERTPSLSALNEIIYGSLRGLGESSEDPYGDPPASRRFGGPFGARRAVTVHPHSHALSSATSATLASEAAGGPGGAAPPPAPVSVAAGSAAGAGAGSAIGGAGGAPPVVVPAPSGSSSASAYPAPSSSAAAATAAAAAAPPVAASSSASAGSRRAPEGGLAGSLAHAADLAGGIAHAAGDAMANLRFGASSSDVTFSPRRSARSSAVADSPRGLNGSGTFSGGSQRNDPFVFSMAVTNSSGPHPRVLYGVAVFVQEMVQHVPTLARPRWPGPPRRLRRRSPVALRAYCLLSMIPAFDLHLRVLHLLLGLERLDRIAALSAQLVPDGIATPAWDSNAAERLRTLGLDDSEESGEEERSDVVPGDRASAAAAVAAAPANPAAAATTPGPSPEAVVTKALKASSSRASLATAVPSGPYGTAVPLKSAKEISESSDEGIKRITAIRAKLDLATQALGLASPRSASEDAGAPGLSRKGAASVGGIAGNADRAVFATTASAPPGGALALGSASSGSVAPPEVSAAPPSNVAAPSALGRPGASATRPSGGADISAARDESAPALGGSKASRAAEVNSTSAVPEGPVGTSSETFVDASAALPSEESFQSSAAAPSTVASELAQAPPSPRESASAGASSNPATSRSSGPLPPPLSEGSSTASRFASVAPSATKVADDQGGSTVDDADAEVEAPARAGSVDSAAYTPFAAAAAVGIAPEPAVGAAFVSGAARRASALCAQSSDVDSTASHGDGSSRPRLPLSPRRTGSSQISRSPTPQPAAARAASRGAVDRSASLPVVAPARSMSSGTSDAFATPTENGGVTPVPEEVEKTDAISRRSRGRSFRTPEGSALAPEPATKLKPVRVPSAPASIDAPRTPIMTTRKVLVAFGQVEAPPYGGTLVFRPDPGLPALTWTRTDVAEASTHLGLAPGCVPPDDIEAAMELADWTLNALCDALSVDSLLSFLTAVLLEQQTVVFCPDLGRLTAVVLALRPLILPFSWQCLMLPVLPASPQHLELLDAPVPFVLGLQHKTAEVLARCKSHVRVNVYKDSVGGVSRLPTLPRRAALADAIAPLHARLRAIARAQSSSAMLRSVSPEARAVARALLAAVRAHLFSLVEDIRYYSVTDISEANTRTSVLLREAFVDAFPQKDRAFMRAFTDTQLFSVYSDLVLATPK